MGNSSGSVDSLVGSTATKIEKHGDSALHVDDSKLPAAKDLLQKDWEDAQKHGPGFMRAVNEKMQSDTASWGSNSIKVDLDKNVIEITPSSFDFYEKRSSVKVTGGADPKDQLFKGTGFEPADAADKLFYLNYKSPHGAYYNPLRPVGLGELNPGQSTDGFIANNGGKIDQRTAKSIKNADGSTTHTYEGQVGGGMYKEMAGLLKSWGENNLPGDVTTSFKAKETVGADGKTLESMEIHYDKPKTFMMNAQNGINERGIECDGVTDIVGNRRSDGDYQAQINLSGGERMYCQIDKSGHVVSTQTFPSERDRQSNKDPNFWWNKPNPEWWEKR